MSFKKPLLTSSELYDAWVALRHGGNLLSMDALQQLPALKTTFSNLSFRLREARNGFEPGKSGNNGLGALLDVVLESACGLCYGWEKGSSVSRTEGARLLDGSVLKPRRLWKSTEGDTLAVFSTPVKRLGLGKGKRPVAQVVEYLRKKKYPLGLLTNGLQWRLFWADVDSLAWVEWEMDRWQEGEQLSEELMVMRLLLSPTCLTRDSSGFSPLLKAIRDTRRGQAKLSKELGERVRKSVELLLRSRASSIGEVWEEHRSQELYVASCSFVMRLVVVLFAEARELLPVDNAVYHHSYGLRGLLDKLDRLTPEQRRSRTSAWPRLLSLFKLLHQGSAHPAILLPAYGGDLFLSGNPAGTGMQRSLALLETMKDSPSDEVIHQILLLLTRTSQKIREGSGWRKVAVPVDFTELTSEYIGILYEGLLDYELHRVSEEPVLFLNLGSQPALPLDRLESMDDKAIKALLASLKEKSSSSKDTEEEVEEEVEEEETDEADDTNDSVDKEEEEVQEDLRGEARLRALEWAKRVVGVGGLVKKPRSKKPEVLARYEAQVKQASSRLIADIKLPGELYLVRWGGTRKGSGTFYTRPQLTLPTVRRTLEPLFYQQGEKKLRSPEELLALKVCDPAMGSGSFLVAALRVLTQAVIESLHVHERIRETDNKRKAVDCELFAETERNLPAEGSEDYLEAIVRRVVVEHCLYGADLNPLAVELARVSLWIETLDKRLPFTFLDHKLRCGNALIGTWLDRFRDYPLLCFERKSPDYEYNGVHYEANVWQNELQALKEEAVSEQASLLSSTEDWLRPGVDDESLKKAVERVRRLYRELRAVPSSQPDRRAQIWRERIQTDASLAQVREAFDTWCALWFWPLDQLAEMPLPRTFASPTESAKQIVGTIKEQQRFLHWELEFPDVFDSPGAGFHAIVGNPPWDIMKPKSNEFFSNIDPLYRSYGKQKGLLSQKNIFQRNLELEKSWLQYQGSFKDVGNFVRNAAEPFGDGKVSKHKGNSVSLGSNNKALHLEWKRQRSRYRCHSDSAHPFRHQGSGDLNTYKMFVETGHALLQKGGQLGLIVPSGLYTDKGTGALRKLLLQDCQWRWLYSFENRNKLFDIHPSFKFCVVVAGKGGETEQIQTSFMRHNLEDWGEMRNIIIYSKEYVFKLSPETMALVEVSKLHWSVLESTHENSIPLGGKHSTGWKVTHCREFHMTDDVQHFRRLDSLHNQKGSHSGLWSLDESTFVPLYQGRMIGLFNHNRAHWIRGAAKQAKWNTKSAPYSLFRSQYLIKFSYAAETKPSSVKTRCVMRNVAPSTNSRTFINAVIPPYPSGNSLSRLDSKLPGKLIPWRLSGFLSSFVFDWLVRSRVSGSNLSWAFIQYVPIPEPYCFGASFVEKLAFRASANSYSFAEEWLTSKEELGLVPFRNWSISHHERLRLKCMIDAIVALEYQLDRASFSWILRDTDHSVERTSNKKFCRQLDPKGFWRVDKKQPPELRHTVLSLVAFDDLQQCIEEADGDKEAGIKAFCEQNDGDGWMLPETLCIAELGMTRTVRVGDYDERARDPQPVRSVMGERFLDWQLEKTPEESWAECEYHAQVLRESMLWLVEEENEEPLPTDLFGNVIESSSPKRRK